MREGDMRSNVKTNCPDGGWIGILITLSILLLIFIVAWFVIAFIDANAWIFKDWATVLFNKTKDLVRIKQ